MGPNMSEVEFHCFCCCSSLRAWDEKCHFSEAAYHYLDFIMLVLGCLKSTKEVH
jgi:hypothetical protein